MKRTIDLDQIRVVQADNHVIYHELVRIQIAERSYA